MQEFYMQGGGYICFVDHDDWIPQNSIELLHRKMMETKADLVWGNNRSVYSFFCAPVFFYNRKAEVVYDCTDVGAFAKFLPRTGFSPWAKLYSKEIIQRYSLLFSPDMLAQEDTHFVLRYLKHCRSVYVIPQNVYYWSKLPSVSGLRTYCAETNRCTAECRKIRLSLFEGTRLPESEIHALYFSLYLDGLSPYAKLPREQAIQKFRETQKLYADMLNNVDNAMPEHQNDRNLRRYYEYKELLDAGDYHAVYDLIQRDHRAERRTKKAIVKRLLVPFRPLSRFLIYRLQLFYRD